MENWVTKKNILRVASVVVVFLALVLIFLPSPYRCGVYENICDSFGNTFLVLIVFLPLFLFSLITYRMREEVFLAWWMFTRLWVPLSMLLVLLMPSDNGPFIPIDKGHVSILMSGFFFLLSAAIVVTTSVKTRKT